MGKSTTPTCAACGAPATVFITLVEGGKNVSVAWCETHAAETGAFAADTYALLDRASPGGRRNGEASPRCPVCDCSQRDFERQGRFGCPACYGAFAGLLPPLLRRMHREGDHRGKIPARGADPAAVRHRLAVLQAELSDAVRAQKFEGAAQTRDAIAMLKAKLLEESALPPTPTPPSRPAAK